MELPHLGTSDTGFTYTGAYDLNDSGTVVGYAIKYISGIDDGTRAVRWDATGVLTELGLLGTNTSAQTHSHARAINSEGTAVGDEIHDSQYLGSRAVRWDATGTAATELGNLGTIDGWTYSNAVAINDSGTAVGSALKVQSEMLYNPVAVRWDASGTAATELSSLGIHSEYGAWSEAVAINSGGYIAGSSDKYVLDIYLGTRAVVWNSGGTTLTELTTLGTALDGRASSYANAINDSGIIVGHAEKYISGSYYGRRAVRWDLSGAATELGMLGVPAGEVDSDAVAVNESGTAVGRIEKYVDGVLVGDRAVAWKTDAIAIDLNTLIDPASGWTLTNAYSISDTNWVAGKGNFDPDGPGGADAYWRMFVLRLPTTLAGDFNSDGHVDAADYVMWRKNLGGIYTPDDYNTWRSHFGQTSGNGSSTNTIIPEPESVMLLIGAAAVSLVAHYRGAPSLSKLARSRVRQRRRCGANRSDQFLAV